MPAIYHTKEVDNSFDGAVTHITESTSADDVVWHCQKAEEGFDGTVFHVKWADQNFDGPVQKVVGIARVIETIVSGVAPLSLPDAVSADIPSLIAFGGTYQGLPGDENITPTPDAPIDIACNNGVLKVDENGNVYADGTQETIVIKDDQNATVSTAVAEMLLKVGDYTDQQEIIDGTVTRKVGIKVLDGTENFETATATNCYSLTNTLGTGNFADRTIVCSHFANTPTMPGTGDRQGLAFIVNKGQEYTIAFGATTQFSTQALWQQFLADQYANGTPVIVVYPLATETTDTVTPQPMSTAQGDNTAEITQAGMAGLELEVKYMKES